MIRRCISTIYIVRGLYSASVEDALSHSPQPRTRNLISAGVPHLLPSLHVTRGWFGGCGTLPLILSPSIGSAPSSPATAAVARIAVATCRRDGIQSQARAASDMHHTVPRNAWSRRRRRWSLVAGSGFVPLHSRCSAPMVRSICSSFPPAQIHSSPSLIPWVQAHRCMSTVDPFSRLSSPSQAQAPAGKGIISTYARDRESTAEYRYYVTSFVRSLPLDWHRSDHSERQVGCILVPPPP
jgi:hypothetical protein